MSIKDDIIAKFGGVNAVALICGVTAGAVSQWTLIPARHQNTLLSAAIKNGINVKPDHFYDLPKRKK